MSVKEADKYLPESRGITDAFEAVKMKHFTIKDSAEEIRQIPIERLRLAASDYFTAGVAFLANRGHDEYMQEVGTTTWWAVNQKLVVVAMTEDMREAAILLGVPPRVARTFYSKDDEPHVIFASSRESGTQREVAFILMPPEFIVKAQSRPIEALATMAWLCSQVRDMANGRLYIDREHFTERAEATEAHFLFEAIEHHPETQLAPEYRNSMELYPQGINSLPRTIIYRGMSGTEFREAPSN
ncbi:MAG: hypothetical protein A3A65_04135 [Candidatus Chisholmbacteria bacterium RIFCSPLOWO2_01_FULL_49_14]|uniref:Uncharacterized protein n=1 Tax=Candidatus Chisholmbacteria bacterium RIFCSPLOWO2_01_FULL_49_14 TaxID=1797593 RepID=A0A1G1VV42_9BACT|nr:MAG: hypothetical protein A3A65_04135 [Candidatus Chisholmbacteria bacterium RIFCSPLOWO2_01_FULL_49_14]